MVASGSTCFVALSLLLYLICSAPVPAAGDEIFQVIRLSRLAMKTHDSHLDAANGIL